MSLWREEATLHHPRDLSHFSATPRDFRKVISLSHFTTATDRHEWKNHLRVSHISRAMPELNNKGRTTDRLAESSLTLRFVSMALLSAPEEERERDPFKRDRGTQSSEHKERREETGFATGVKGVQIADIPATLCASMGR